MAGSITNGDYNAIVHIRAWHGAYLASYQSFIGWVRPAFVNVPSPWEIVPSRFGGYFIQQRRNLFKGRENELLRWHTYDEIDDVELCFIDEAKNESKIASQQSFEISPHLAGGFTIFSVFRHRFIAAHPDRRSQPIVLSSGHPTSPTFLVVSSASVTTWGQFFIDYVSKIPTVPAA